MGIPNYNLHNWHLFIDRAKAGLKRVVAMGNSYVSMPVGHFTTSKERDESLQIVCQKLAYEEHQWLLCVDRKMVNCLLGSKPDTQNICVLITLGQQSSKLAVEKKEWPLKSIMNVVTANIINNLLVSRENLILPPLYI